MFLKTSHDDVYCAITLQQVPCDFIEVKLSK